MNKTKLMLLVAIMNRAAIHLAFAASDVGQKEKFDIAFNAYETAAGVVIDAVKELRE